MPDKNRYKHRPVLHWVVLLSFIAGGIGFGGWQAMVHPNTPLPSEWNPVQPLVIDDPLTSLTSWKLSRALGSPATCLAALETGAQIERKPDFVETPRCGITPQVSLSRAGGASIAPVNTKCQTALRLAMWTQHALQPAAQELFGQDIAEIKHFSSYSCRPIRTASGNSSRMSSHATADAIDISGFVLADGTRLSLLRDWSGDPTKSAFLKRANTTACDWFRLTLGPRYNRLHADHFHLQHTGNGLCR